MVSDRSHHVPTINSGYGGRNANLLIACMAASIGYEGADREVVVSWFTMGDSGTGLTGGMVTGITCAGHGNIVV